MSVNPKWVFLKLVMFFLWYLSPILVRSDGTASLPSGGAASPNAGGRRQDLPPARRRSSAVKTLASFSSDDDHRVISMTYRNDARSLAETGVADTVS